MLDMLAAQIPAAPAQTDLAPTPGMVRTSIHALRAGTWPASPSDLTLTAADLAAIAAAYDPARYQAPVVIGHPEQDDPAWGWVLGAHAAGDELFLDVELLPDMAELVRSGRYRAVSVSLWTPGAPGNPSPAWFALKHLGFLGAKPPAVKGLAPVRLDAADASAGTVSVTCGERTMPENTEVTLAQREAALAEREAALATRETDAQRREAQLRRTAFRTEAEGHVAAGRITAAEVEPIVALMERLDGAEVVTLAEGDARPPIELFRAHLAGLPARVELGERGTGRDRVGPGLPKVPSGYRLSEHGLGLHERAVEYQAAHPNTAYLDAVRAVQATA